MNDKTPQQDHEVHAFGPFKLEAAERRLSQDGALLALPTKVFDLLLLLVRSPGRLQTREELIAALWPDTIIEEHGLTSRISALRKALGDEGEVARYIETVRGHGYRFVAGVTSPAPTVAPTITSAVATPQPARRWLLVAGAGLLVAALLWRALSIRSEAPAPAVPDRSIAVLPFVNLSTDPANTYFASGIQDMILTRLAVIGDLRVISRTSTAKYASRPQDIKAAGRDFGVATILEGSVQKSGEQVLINVQLIDARNDEHLWAQAYTRRLDDVFGVESEVAERVAAALKTHLLPAEAARLASAPTHNARAYDLFLQAEYLANQVEQGGARASQDAYAQASRLYARAIAEDAGFALAQARFSFLQSYARWFGVDSAPERMAEAERAARSALQSDLPQAHLAMGYVYYWGHRDYAKALTEFSKARQGLPNDAAVSGAIAFIQRRQGKWDEALAGLEQAEIIDPRNSLWFCERGNTYAYMRRYAEAEHEFARASAVDPQTYRLVAYKAATQLLAGERDAARATLDKVPPGSDPTGVVASVRYRLAWLQRDPDRAMAAIAQSDAEWIEDPFLSSVPVGLLRAQARQLKGDAAGAHDEYAKTKEMLEVQLREQPDDFNLISALSVVDAGLGDKDAAIRNARRAVELVPVSRDAIRGPAHLANLAETYARFGDASPAVEILRLLLDMPAGAFVSVPLLRDDARWDGIRADSGFQALLDSHSEPHPDRVGGVAAQR